MGGEPEGSASLRRARFLRKRRTVGEEEGPRTPPTDGPDVVAATSRDIPGYLGPLLRPLLLLLVAEEPGHGYGLRERLGALGVRPRQGSAVYRELRDLDAGGRIESDWEASQTRGPTRRMYRLTAEGRRELDELMVAVESVAKALDEALVRYRALGPWEPSSRKRSPTAVQPQAPAKKTRRGR